MLSVVALSTIAIQSDFELKQNELHDYQISPSNQTALAYVISKQRKKIPENPIANELAAI